MAKAARRYDIYIYLPLTYNDGRLIADALFEAVERRLIAHFGGVTSQQRDFPLRGLWQGETQIYLDKVVIMTALDFRPRGSARFIASLKRDVLRAFDQLAVLITESSLRVH